jgi:hypothetical protein
MRAASKQLLGIEQVAFSTKLAAPRIADQCLGNIVGIGALSNLALHGLGDGFQVEA